ncbi:hypothetical protein HanRHA438_Chr06g0261701 [Helianthus annuus]|nr:hypothetical protein HanRHA438_Chr06g0261701 [Helianthus annuus]
MQPKYQYTHQSTNTPNLQLPTVLGNSGTSYNAKNVKIHHATSRGAKESRGCLGTLVTKYPFIRLMLFASRIHTPSSIPIIMIS